jgi:hypothetical protein
MAAASREVDARRALEDRMEAVRSVFRVVVARLADEGRLDTSWEIDPAAEALCSLAHFRTYDDLVVGRRWAPACFVEMQVRQAGALLLAPA